MKTNAVTPLLRIILGILFFAHGLDKFNTGLANVGQWFESVQVPSFMAYVVAPIELIGGILLVLGLFTRVVSVLFVGVLAGAIVTVKFSMGLLGGYELDLAFLAMALFLVFAERSSFSVDHLLFRNRG
ncbi:DoxX family protein [Gorillibacterium sp. CAU 1737]|uniref:DoxX family protein n=1 Tax=Gorillibacterium sp. CAU 1737 TaxID=3140362 RepID=UPI003260F914